MANSKESKKLISTTAALRSNNTNISFFEEKNNFVQLLNVIAEIAVFVRKQLIF